jgi:hypothetical protein
MSKRCKLQKEYYQQYGNYKGTGKYNDKYVAWLEEQVLNLRKDDSSDLQLTKDCEYFNSSLCDCTGDYCKV